jgi:SAM-dependent MidA family methyltransferase
MWVARLVTLPSAIDGLRPAARVGTRPTGGATITLVTGARDDNHPVARRLTERIAREGPLPFAAVMEDALYGEGGYYTRDPPAIGMEGDYVTGSSLSPLFGRATARVVERVAGAMGRPADYVEIGYGGGEHLETVATSLDGRRAGRLLAWDRVARPVPPGVRALRDLAELGELGFEGVVFSYELFDALPVHRLIGRADGRVGELLVDWRAQDGFVYVESDLSSAQLEDLLGGHRLEPGQVADVAPSWRSLYGELARGLRRGLLITCDYGYERVRLFDARIRRYGTVACYSRHRVSRDALADLGRRDLTAHVDFTALRECGEAAGLETVAFTRQAPWLVAAGIFDEIAATGAPASAQARMLLDGEGMGEEIRVLVQCTGVEGRDLLGAAALL